MKHASDSCLWNINIFMIYNIFLVLFRILPVPRISKPNPLSGIRYTGITHPERCQAIIQFGICQLRRLFYWKPIWGHIYRSIKNTRVGKVSDTPLIWWVAIRHKYVLSLDIYFKAWLDTIQTESTNQKLYEKFLFFGICRRNLVRENTIYKLPLLLFLSVLRM